MIRGCAAGLLRAVDTPMYRSEASLQLGDASEARVCKRCGAALADDAMFCDECIVVLLEQAKKTNQQQIEILRRELERRRRGTGEQGG